jgi:hypothetical protein
MKMDRVNRPHHRKDANPLSAVLMLPRVAAMVMVMVRRVRTRRALTAARFPGRAGAAEMGLAPVV